MFDIFVQRLPVFVAVSVVGSALVLAGIAILKVRRYSETLVRLDPKRRVSKRGVSSLSDENDQKLSVNEIQRELTALKEWIIEKDPEFLVGVHLSGLMLAAKLATEIGIGHRRIAYYATTKSLSSEPELHLYGNNQGLEGKICVIDDVTRRGLTMEQVSNKIHDQYQIGNNRVKDALYGVMVTVRSESKIESGYFDPHFSASESDNIGISMPWSRMVFEIRDEIQKMKDKKEYDKRKISFYNKIIKDPKFAEFCINYIISDHLKFYKNFESEQMYSLYKENRYSKGDRN